MKRTTPSAVADALLPVGRQRLLAALLTQPGTELHLRELARQTRLAPASVQREVQSLTQAGILARRQVGRQTFYRADPRCAVATELAHLIAKTVGLAGLLAEALQSVAARIRYAAIFGSVARGEALPESDLDLLVLGDVTLVELVGCLREFRASIQREVNIVQMEPVAWARLAAEGDPFVQDVCNGARVTIMGDESALTATGG